MTEYTEYEIRTVPSDSRKYNIAKFANAAASDGDKKKAVPDFKSEMKPPVYMRYEEIPAPPEAAKLPGEEEREEEARGRAGFKRRRRYYNRNEHRWVLRDGKKNHVYHGLEEAQHSNYVVFIPPTAQNEPFRVVPIEKWFEFKAAQKFVPLSMEQAEEVLTKKMNMTSSRMKKLVERQKEEFQQEKAKRGLDDSDEGAGSDAAEENWFSVTAPEKKPRKAVDEGEAVSDEDIEVMAIDRIRLNGADSFADVVEDPDAAQDNEDDGAEFAAEEMRDSEERLLQEAENMREAAEEEALAEEDDGGAEEEDYEEEIEDVLDSEHVGDLNKLHDEDDDDMNNERMKVFSEKYYRPMERFRQLAEPSAKNNDSQKVEPVPEKLAPAAATTGVAETEQPKEAEKTKEEKETKAAENAASKKSVTKVKLTLEQSIAQILRHNQGKMKTKALLKEAKKKGLVDDIKSFKAALMKVCNIEDDVVHGKMLVLKKK